MNFFNKIFENNAKHTPDKGNSTVEAAAARMKKTPSKPVNVPVTFIEDEPTVTTEKSEDIKQTIEAKKGEVVLSDSGMEVLKAFKSSLETQGVPEQEKSDYIDRFMTEIDGESDENIINNVFNNIIWDAMQKVKASKSEKKAEEGVLLENAAYKKQRDAFSAAFDDMLHEPLITEMHDDFELKLIRDEFNRIINVLRKENKLNVRSHEVRDIWKAIAERILKEADIEDRSLTLLNALLTKVLKETETAQMEQQAEVTVEPLKEKTDEIAPESQEVSTGVTKETIAEPVVQQMPAIEVTNIADKKRKPDALKKKIERTNGVIDNAERVRVEKAERGERVDTIVLMHIGVPSNLPEEEHKKIISRIEAANINILADKKEYAAKKKAQLELEKKRKREQGNDVWTKELEGAIGKIKQMTLEEAENHYETNQLVETFAGDYAKKLSDFLHLHLHDSIDQFSTKEKESFENVLESARKINDENSLFEIVIINGNTYKFKKEVPVAPETVETKKIEKEKEAELEFENKEMVTGLTEKHVEIFRKNAAIFMENLKKSAEESEKKSGVVEMITAEERDVLYGIYTKRFLREQIAKRESVMKDKKRYVSEKKEELVEFVCSAILK